MQRSTYYRSSQSAREEDYYTEGKQHAKEGHPALEATITPPR